MGRLACVACGTMYDSAASDAKYPVHWCSRGCEALSEITWKADCEDIVIARPWLADANWAIVKLGIWLTVAGTGLWVLSIAAEHRSWVGLAGSLAVVVGALGLAYDEHRVWRQAEADEERRARIMRAEWREEGDGRW